MIYFFVMISFIAFMFAFGTDETNSTIKLNDINVGDKIKIKGQTFIVKGYSATGNMEMVDNTTKYTYIIKIDDDTILTSHNKNGKRKYITIDNFEGTVGSNYLNKFSFK